MMKIIIFVLAITTICFCNGGEKPTINTLEIWYLPFSIDTRFPIDEQTIEKCSQTRHAKILDQIKFKQFDKLVNNLKELKDSNTVYKNIRILIKLRKANDKDMQFSINYDKKKVFYSDKIFYCNRSLIALVMAEFD